MFSSFFLCKQIDEIELVKKDVEVFVQLCTNLVKYSKEAVIDPKGILSRFFSIMERFEILNFRKTKERKMINNLNTIKIFIIKVYE